MSDKSLTIRRFYDAPVEKVFQAFTTPEALKKWFVPSEDMDLPIADVDFRVGGKYRIGMHSAEKDKMFVAAGEYKDIVEDSKIVMSWSWEHWPDDQEESILSFEFAEKDGGTELILKHEQLESDESVKDHTSGWEGCLKSLENHWL